MLQLTDIVRDFATAIKSVDTERPEAKSSRSGRTYQPGIGPFAEDAAVDLVVAKLRNLKPGQYDRCACRSLYPGSKQHHVGYMVAQHVSSVFSTCHYWNVNQDLMGRKVGNRIELLVTDGTGKIHKGKKHVEKWNIVSMFSL